MAIEERFTAIITARNAAGAVLRQIGAQFAALSQQTGLSRIASAAAGVGRAFGSLALQIGQVAGPLAAIGASAAAIGLGSMAARTAAAAGALSDLSARTGISVQDLQELGDSARLAGVDQNTLATALQRLNRGLAEAAAGGGGDLGPLLRHLGISMRDANGQIRNAVDLLPELADVFQRNENQALRTRAATELFGRAGEQLIPMLANGSRALEESRQRFRQYGFSMAESADGLAKIDDVFETLQVATEGLTQAIGAGLAPVLGPIAQGLADWVRANRDLIATGIGEWAERTSAAIGAFFADRGPLERLADFAATLSGTVEALGGMQNVLIGFGAIAALPFIAALASIVTAFVPLMTAIGALGAALLAGSPVGLAIVAFGAMAAVLVSQWEPISAFFRDLWASVTRIFDAAWERIRPVAEAIGAAASVLTGGSSPTGPVAAPDAQQQRRTNWRNRGALGAEGGEPRIIGMSRPLPSVLPSLSNIAPPPAQEGRVTVDVNLNNAPPGTRVEAASNGPLVREPNTSVGYALGRAPR